MASAVLSVAAAAIAGPLGPVAAAGIAIGAGAVGAVIDRAILFKPEDQYQPRSDTEDRSSGSEHSPINYLYGGIARVTADVIWAGDMIEERDSHHYGGNWGGYRVHYYNYYRDVAICAGKLPAGITANAFNSVWMNGQRVWHDSDAIIKSGSIDFTTRLVLLNERPDDEYKYEPNFYQVYYYYHSSTVDLTAFRAGLGVSISGYAESLANSGFRRIDEVGSDFEGTGDSFVLWISDQIVWFGTLDSVPGDEAGTGDESISYDLPDIKRGLADDVETYLGDQVTASPTIVEDEGADNVPTYKGLALMVFKRLHLEGWGNQLPSQFHIQLEVDTAAIEVYTVIDRILHQAGMKEASYDLSGVDQSQTVSSFWTEGPVRPGESLRHLMLAFNIGSRQRGGCHYFYTRGSEDTIDIAASDLGPQEGERRDGSVPFSVADPAEFEIPGSVSVGFPDSSNKNIRGSVTSRRQWSDDGEDVSVSTPVPLTSSEARDLAKRYLWETISRRQSTEGFLTPNYWYAEPGDSLVFPASFGGTVTTLAHELARGDNGIISFRGPIRDYVAEDLESDDEDVDEREPYLDQEQPVRGSIVPITTVALRPDHADEEGFYIGVAQHQNTITFRGCEVWTSHDNSHYEFLTFVDDFAPTGRVLTTLPVGPTYCWDESSTVDVHMDFGTPVSHTEEEVMNGQGLWLIGSEIIGVRTVTALTDRRYRLSNMLRGLYGTESNAKTHLPITEGYERCLELLPASIIWVPTETAQFGPDIYFKLVTPGYDIDDYNPVLVHVGWGGLRPLSPVHLHWKRRAAGDYSVAWQPRSTKLTRFFSFNRVPTSDVVQNFQLERWSEFFSGASYPQIKEDGATGVEDFTSSIFRADAGSWISDGYAAGDVVQTIGFDELGNNRIWVVQSVTAKYMYVWDPNSVAVTEFGGIPNNAMRNREELEDISGINTTTISTFGSSDTLKIFELSKLSDRSLAYEWDKE